MTAGSGRQGLGDSGFHGKVQGTRDAGKRSRNAAPVRRPVRPPAPVPQGVRVGWREAIAGTVGGLGYELVDVERAQRGLLRITIDRIAGRTYTPPGEFITVDDCEQVTRQLQYALEVEGLEYSRLEVSSPGLDRPLKTEDHFERFAGLAVSVTLKAPFEGRKVWQGVLGKADAGGWTLVFKVGKAERALAFKFEEVREARLVPVLDFKGRKSNDSGSAGAASDAVPGTDGG